MKTAAKIRIVAWSVAAVALLGFLVGGLNGNLPWLSLGAFSYEHSDRYTPGNGSLPAASVGALEVNWVSGGVAVEEHGGTDILFSETSSKELDDGSRLQYYLDGDTLKIQFCAPRSPIARSGKVLKQLTVLVPTGHPLARLKVESVSAAVRVTGISAGEADVESVSGNISLNRLSAAELDLETVSGTLESVASAADRLTLESVSGKIELAGSYGQVRGSTVSGSMQIAPGAGVSAVDLESVSGSVTIDIPPEVGFFLEYSTVSGGVDTDFETSGGKGHMTHQNGGADFQVETVSGSIRVLRV